ncbi:unnamed protein product [Effrenium voratum]|uniref:Uncharacterized protein n=1 Tax=Effrenium voratum TaxID=2562239 RepID=A0AA36HS59_9DINO|nr:unnamed protein product [Effrenium voratum]CAJ1418119.1 unnamed protein product [Effrenium voratum]
MDVVTYQEDRLADAMSTISDVLNNIRRLQTVECSPEKVDLNDAHNIAQICQGVGFIGLAMWLIFANNSKVAVAQKAPLEQRHAVCATISTAVALFSGFFNILQLTAIDDFDLPGRASTFTLNLSRPVEWLATCPIMQLKLVVLAGARVPSYRRFMMPLLSVAVLLCGTASMFTADALRFAWYAFGIMLAFIMFYHNVLQIKENSEGEEGAFNGDSDFRKLSLLLIVTWFPFPIWFSLSVEGFGLITDPLVIELGWVVLNLVSKFTFIIWMQRMKMVHQRKLEAARELYGLSPTDEVAEEELRAKSVLDGKATGRASDYGLGFGEEAESEEKLVEVVSETMVTLGMSAHTDRLLRLMVENGVTNTAVLERLNAERCMELNLPWTLIESSQRRWISEKMNMGQDQGGSVEKEDPFKKLLEANKERMTGKGLLHSLPGAMPMSMAGMAGMSTPPVAGFMGDMGSVEEHINNAMERYLMPFQDAVMTKLQFMEDNLQRQLENTQEAISQRMDFSQVALLQTVNACQVLLHKLDSSQESVVHKLDAHKVGVDTLVCNITGANDTTKQALLDSVNTSSSMMLQKLDATQQDLLKQTRESHSVLQKVSGSQDTMMKKVDSGNEFTQRRLVEMESTMERKMTEVSGTVCKSQTDSSAQLLTNLRQDLATLAAQGNATVDATEKSSAVQEECMADVRRQNMMIMDMLTNAQETMHTSAESLHTFTRSEIMRDSATNMEMQLREVIVKQMSQLQEALIGEDVSGKGQANLKEAVHAMVERLEDGARRLELASTQGQAGVGASSPDMEEMIRRELAAVALAMSQQHREVAQESLMQVGEAVRGELSSFKDVQVQMSGSLTEKVTELAEVVATNMTRLETGVDKVLQTVESGSKAVGASGGERRTTGRGERG